MATVAVDGSLQADSHWESECLDVNNYKWRLNPAWHRVLYRCTHVATVGVKGLTPPPPLRVTLLGFLSTV